MTTHRCAQATVKLHHHQLVEHRSDLIVVRRRLKVIVIHHGAFRQSLDFIPIKRRTGLLQESSEKGRKTSHLFAERVLFVTRRCLDESFELTLHTTESIALCELVKLFGIAWHARMGAILWKKKKTKHNENYSLVHVDLL